MWDVLSFCLLHLPNLLFSLHLALNSCIKTLHLCTSTLSSSSSFCWPSLLLSPQISIRVSSQGLRLLCLLTCSSLSQVKPAPPPPLFFLSRSSSSSVCCSVWGCLVLSSVGGSMSLWTWSHHFCVQLFFQQWFKLVPFPSVQMSVRAKEETTRGRRYDPAGRPHQGAMCKPVGTPSERLWTGFNQEWATPHRSAHQLPTVQYPFLNSFTSIEKANTIF